MIKLQAHRGVCSKYPENTMAAFRAAVNEGYDLIEFDPKYTSDGEIVILHDRTLNRTARKNGQAPETETKICDLTLRDAREYEYGSWFSPEFEGEQLPLITELLDYATETKIKLKLDNVWESFPEKIKEKLFCIIDGYGNKLDLGFTCARLESIERVANRFPCADIHYDGGDLSAVCLDKVAALSKGHRLYIWVCFDNEMTKWFKGTKASREVCKFVKSYGELGIWILSKREELTPAIKEFGAQLIETTGHIKPDWLKDFQ